MERRKTERLGDMIDSWLKKQGKHSNMLKAHVVNRWEEFVGKPAARYTESVKFVNNELHVKLRSAVVKRELELIKTPLIEKINQEAKCEIVINIIFTA
jgi:uncharacterized membrane protein YheB (UPF0754 family)